MKSRSNLHPYQERAITFIKTTKKCALHLDMGLGKTVIALSAIADLIKEKGVSKVLVIAPLRVANEVWHQELQNWTHTFHLTYSIVTGDVNNRIKALKQKANIHIINRENVFWLYTKDKCWDVIVIDEASDFKNPGSKRFKSLAKFQYRYMVELTGTPVPNSLLDLWSQIYLLDKGDSLGRSMTSYKERFFVSDFMGYTFTPKDPAVIFDKIKHLAISMSASDYLELPDKINLTTNVIIKQLDKYKELKREYVTTLENTDITSVNAAVLTNKLLQFCNGVIYDELKNMIEAHSSKLDVLEEILENNPTTTFLVAYTYKSDLLRLQKRFPYAKILDRSGNVLRDWNAGIVRLLLCNPATSKGLNLQKGGNNIIWFGLTWNLEDYLQFNARLYRQGQSKPVFINHIVAKDCIDEVIIDRLADKNVTQEALFTALTDIKYKVS